MLVWVFKVVSHAMAVDFRGFHRIFRKFVGFQEFSHRV
jgi:hypothetical protein